MTIAETVELFQKIRAFFIIRNFVNMENAQVDRTLTRSIFSLFRSQVSLRKNSRPPFRSSSSLISFSHLLVLLLPLPPYHFLFSNPRPVKRERWRTGLSG